MRVFRRTELHGLVAVTPQDQASFGSHPEGAWKEDTLRRREETNSTSSVPAVPGSLVSEPVSPSTLLPTQAAVPSTTKLQTTDGAGLLGLSSLSILPTAAASTEASPSASSSAGGDGLLGVGIGASLGVGGLLGASSNPISTQETAPSTSIAPVSTSVAPETPTVAPTSTVVPVSSIQPVTSASPATSQAAETPTTNAIPPASVQSIPTTSPEAAPEAASSTSQVVPVQPATTPPVVQSSSSVGPVHQSSSTAPAILPAQSSSNIAASAKGSSQASLASSAPQSPSAILSSSVSVKGINSAISAQHKSIDGSSTLATVPSIAPSAAADLNNPTLTNSILKSITKTGSVPGITTQTSSSGIVVTETIQPSKGMSAGAMAGVIVGAAAGGLLIAALILYFVRKFRRIRRMAKAESPPSSPLLDASYGPMSPTAPLRIEVGMHQRMRSDESNFWVSGKGSSINEKEAEGHGYPMPISPLPSLSEAPEVDVEMVSPNPGRSNVPNAALMPSPNVDRSGEEKEVVPMEY